MKKLLRKNSKNLSCLISHLSISKGFTLIELLVVIAVLGVLASIVLLAVNPGEQLARARDTSRISAVTQMGRTLQGYATANSAIYPAYLAANDWMGVLTATNDLKTKVGGLTYGSTGAGTNTPASCNTAFVQTVFPAGVTNGTLGFGYCYQNTNTITTNTTLTGADAIVYAPLESTLNKNKCPVGPPAQYAWSVFATTLARAGIWCGVSGAEPTVANVTSLQ
mgnify:FL=1